MTTYLSDFEASSLVMPVTPDHGPSAAGAGSGGGGVAGAAAAARTEAPARHTAPHGPLEEEAAAAAASGAEVALQHSDDPCGGDDGHGGGDLKIDYHHGSIQGVVALGLAARCAPCNPVHPPDVTGLTPLPFLLYDLLTSMAGRWQRPPTPAAAAAAAETARADASVQASLSRPTSANEATSALDAEGTACVERGQLEGGGQLAERQQQGAAAAAPSPTDTPRSTDTGGASAPAPARALAEPSRASSTEKQGAALAGHKRVIGKWRLRVAGLRLLSSTGGGVTGGGREDPSDSQSYDAMAGCTPVVSASVVSRIWTSPKGRPVSRSAGVRAGARGPGGPKAAAAAAALSHGQQLRRQRQLMAKTFSTPAMIRPAVQRSVHAIDVDDGVPKQMRKNNKKKKKKKMKKKKKPADSSSLHLHGAAQPAFQASFDTAEQLAWAWCVDS
jgi:hypothetical protein